jgi:phage shock protein PspC (stress-responsive transcriptional regulator)
MQDQNNNMYRSSDDKVIAGVCSGISHKLNFSKWGVRFAFIICWMVFKPRPTFNR